MWKSTTAVASILALALVVGCKDDHKHSTNPGTGAATQPAEEDHPNAVAIGETTQGGMTFKATQDEPIEAGGEGAFDLAISGYPEGQKPKAVRFWVGAESGESVKALAEEENPGVWHTHVEVPDPLPADAKFWASIEPATGEALKVSFELAK